MKKCLLFVALIIVSQLNNLKAQTLFSAPDTVCVNQPVMVTSNISASSYYWGFCSGYLVNPPTGHNVGNNLGFAQPSAIDVVKDSDNNYYGFVLNNTTNEFLRLDYGPRLNDTPHITNLGSLTNVLPQFPSTLYVLRDSVSKNWYVFVAGGTDTSNSSLARLDFGHSLNNNAPNIANFGNLFHVLNAPRGLFVTQGDSSKWYGFCVNNATNTLVRFDFEKNISNTPLFRDLGNLNSSLASPTDLAAVYNDGNWYFFITNILNNSITRVDFGNAIENLTPVGNNIGDLGGRLFGPTAISIVRDCGNIYGFITNGTSDELTRMQMPDPTGPYTGTDFGNVAGFASPVALSRIIRDHDNLYAFAVNTRDSSLSQILFPQCSNASIQSSIEKNPPRFSYNTPGLYNIYYAINEGMPDMQVECTTIRVLPYPKIDLSNDTTICQGDTVNLHVISVDANSYTWEPFYNLTDTSSSFIKAWPDYSMQYHVILPYPDGCIVDTTVNITVVKVRADAGPDRTIADGSKTILGGPYTTTDGNYTFTWTPNQFLSNTNTPNPVANPAYDFTYYLNVDTTVIVTAGDTLHCSRTDTVVIHVVCNDFNLPNAFAPGSTNSGANRFGIINRQIIKLNYLRIFDRWGQMVFETTDPTEEWDGNVNGKPAPSGVYVWEADGFCLNGQRFQKTGNVTLIR